MVVSQVLQLTLVIANAYTALSQFHVSSYSQNLFPFVQHPSPALPFVHQQPFAVPSFQHSFPGFSQTYQAPSAFVSSSFNPFVNHETYSIADPRYFAGQQTNVRSNVQQASGKSLEFPQPESVEGNEYGFGYRTQYDDGASSMVVFVSGPQSHKVSFGTSRQASARKLASDLSDSNANGGSNKEIINNSLSNNISNNLTFQTLLESFPAFKILEEPKTSVVHLFSHRSKPVPLVLPISTPAPISSSTPSSDLNSGEVNNDSESVSIDSSDSLESASSGQNFEKQAANVIQEVQARVNNIVNRKSEKSDENSPTEDTPASNSTTISSTSITSTEGSTEKEDDKIESTTTK